MTQQEKTACDKPDQTEKDASCRKEINWLVLETLQWGLYEAYAVRGEEELIAINYPSTLFYVTKSPVPDKLPSNIEETANIWYMTRSQKRILVTDKLEPNSENKTGWEIMTYQELSDICKAHRDDFSNDGLLKKR